MGPICTHAHMKNPIWVWDKIYIQDAQSPSVQPKDCRHTCQTCAHDMLFEQCLKSCLLLLVLCYVVADVLNNHTGRPLDNSTSKVGCNYHKQSWCLDQPKIYLFQYVVGLYILTPGYCASSLICYTMFSKILGPRPQVGRCVCVCVCVRVCVCDFVCLCGYV